MSFNRSTYVGSIREIIMNKITTTLFLVLFSVISCRAMDSTVLHVDHLQDESVASENVQVMPLEEATNMANQMLQEGYPGAEKMILCLDSLQAGIVQLEIKAAQDPVHCKRKIAKILAVQYDLRKLWAEAVFVTEKFLEHEVGWCHEYLEQRAQQVILQKVVRTIEMRSYFKMFLIIIDGIEKTLSSDKLTDNAATIIRSFIKNFKQRRNILRKEWAAYLIRQDNIDKDGADACLEELDELVSDIELVLNEAYKDKEASLRNYQAEEEQFPQAEEHIRQTKGIRANVVVWRNEIFDRIEKAPKIADLDDAAEYEVPQEDEELAKLCERKEQTIDGVIQGLGVLQSISKEILALKLKDNEALPIEQAASAEHYQRICKVLKSMLKGEEFTTYLYKGAVRKDFTVAEVKVLHELQAMILKIEYILNESVSLEETGLLDYRKEFVRKKKEDFAREEEKHTETKAKQDEICLLIAQLKKKAHLKLTKVEAELLEKERKRKNPGLFSRMFK